MNIEYIKLENIKPYKNNPRKNDEAVEYVVNSIKEFGFKNPVILDKDNVIVCGHTRYKAAKELGLKEIPCIIANDLSKEKIKAFRLTDNKVAEKSEWDLELLSNELDEILDLNMEEFGFDKLETINWDSVDKLDDISYDEPLKDTLECPNCKYRDVKTHFKKV